MKEIFEKMSVENKICFYRTLRILFDILRVWDGLIRFKKFILMRGLLVGLYSGTTFFAPE